MDPLVQKAEHLGKLLAHSPLKEEFKEFLLNQLPELTEANLDLLIAALTNEAEIFDKLTVELENFEDGKEGREAAYAEVLQKKLDAVYQQFIKAADKEIDILALKADLEA